ncbi:MAG: hypothetical protein FWC39_05595 [Bacteroidetes bacterium]|nr:hypothetical protein [Bacteroidota bacterium]
MKTIKLILGTFCLVYFLGTAVAQEENVKFFGNVKSVKETTYKVSEKFGEAIKGEILNTAVWKYDDKGRLVEEPYKKYKYDANGNKTEQATHDSVGNLKTRITWSYNEKNKITEQNKYDSDRKLISKTKWKYNDDGYCIDKSKFDKEGKLLEREINVYDKDRYLEHSQYARYDNFEYVEGIDNSVYHGLGHGEVKLVWRCVHSFDEKGKQIQALLLSPNQDTLEIRKNVYDIYGNSIETNYHYSFANVRRKFNEKGKMIKHETGPLDLRRITLFHVDYWEDWRTMDSVRLSYYTFTQLHTYNDKGEIQSISYIDYDGYNLENYDKKGNIMEILRIENYYWECEEEGSWECLTKLVTANFDIKTEYSYTYDQHDNWTKRMEYETERNTPTVCTEIVEREIEYWE